MPAKPLIDILRMVTTAPVGVLDIVIPFVPVTRMDPT